MNQDSSNSGSSIPTDERMANVTVSVGGIGGDALNRAGGANFVTERPQPRATHIKTSNTVYARTPLDELDLGDLAQVQPFTSSEERYQAFRDPRYQRDPLYRQWVNRRIMASGL